MHEDEEYDRAFQRLMKTKEAIERRIAAQVVRLEDEGITGYFPLMIMPESLESEEQRLRLLRVLESLQDEAE
ncbi:hypothetical protein RMSM_01169 [Rhodopirellula maiorica SM1]|uniref:Uncharacterized protein n=1 Tax=Rhodopirellula maiorica SM1 TaxID=1265738 RepID=M5RRJ2_9BACT|nr:hypothetical protein [Rhodopirellula maiorica]EMI21905.1 hypothetical protein RMSM_01169 [Rhodopirellula maiorica SM1]